MRRSRLTQLLHDYVAGDLDADAVAALERRLADDADARALLDEVRAAHDALCVLRDRPEPPRRVEDALPRIQAAIASAGFTPRPVLPLEGEGTRYYRRLAMAATVLFAVTAGLFAFKFAGDGEAPAPTPTPIEAQPLTAAERGLRPFVEEAGRRPEGIRADELFERLRRENGRISDLYVIPVDNALPPVPYTPEER